MFKKRLPLLLTFIAGMLPILSFFFRAPALLEDDPTGNGVVHLSDTFEQWMVILAAAALLLGVVNVFQVNLKKISNRSQGWPYAVVFLSALIVTAVFGLWDAFAHVGNTAWYAQPVDRGGRLAASDDVQSTSMSPRPLSAFRVQRGAGICRGGAADAGRQPLHRAHGALPARFTQWTLNIPTAAAQRGIIIGAALGAASMALRILIGIERSYLGLQKGE
jgi:hypothetical protein